ncbi:hypothetical protein TNCT_351111 [Trichonephila clavata]|uniref:Uncharacterized protein n=1 Tax=Trichonephila clavata TaxID=2740835 RepID=A0A8X6FL31_TRICU|nr:hypothetical protein TNCT_351111 [Trichonephila clavata]
MATESVPKGKRLPISPESDINQENLMNENDGTRESQDDDLPTPNTDSNYLREGALSIFSAACENIQSSTLRPRIPEDYFYRRQRGRQRRRRRSCCQKWKERIQLYTRQIRDSRYFLYILILLMALPAADMVIGIRFSMQCVGLVAIVVLDGSLNFPLIIFRMYVILRGHSFNVIERKRATECSWRLFLLAVLLLVSRMILSYSMTFDFDPSSRNKPNNYCAKDFYDYNHAMNIAKSCVLFIVFLLHIPPYI